MDADKTVTAKFTARCTHADDPTCIRAVYRGGPRDYAQVSDIPAWAIIQSDQHGRYHVGRGWLVTVVTAASPPEGYSQFSLQLRPLEGVLANAPRTVGPSRRRHLHLHRHA